MTKNIRLAPVTFEGQRWHGSIEIEHDTAGRLSITGTINSRDYRGGGQCADTIREVYGHSPTVARLCDIWDRWHLNDLKAGCEHQRATWHPEKVIVTHQISVEWDDFQQLQRDEKADYARMYGGKAGPLKPGADTSRYSPAGSILKVLRALDVRPFAWVTVSPWPGKLEQLTGTAPECVRVPAFKSLAPRLKVRTENKAAGWVYPKDHPDGLLTKPCEVCGYKYGSAWLKEEVPQEVIAELFALPEVIDAEPPAQVRP